MLRATRPILLAAPLIALLAIIVLFFGIRDDPDAETVAGRLSDTHAVHLLGGDRGAVLALPHGLDASEPLTLIVSLHGFGDNAWEHDQYFRLSQATRQQGMALLLPQGLKDAQGRRFWNATEWCCDVEASGVDDVAYLRSLVEETGEIVNVADVVVVGESNGGFMAYRLACDGLPMLRAIVSLAGTSFADAGRCDEAQPVAVLQIHGDADEVVRYDGASGEDNYPGAETVARRWAERAGCDLDAAMTGDSLDLDTGIDGAETTVIRWTEGCAEGRMVELWTIEGGGHDPDVEETLAAQIIAWLETVPDVS